MSDGEGSESWFPGTDLVSMSEGKDLSLIFPFARSMRNSAGFMAIRGEQPIDEKYTIASEAFPEYREHPFPNRISLSNVMNNRLDG